jgi:hypothetical protein
MLRGIAKWWAKLSYIFSLETEAAKNEINGATAKRNAEEKRKLVLQLNSEADAIYENMKKVEKEEEERRAGEEYQKLSKQDQYEDERAAKKEKDDALQIISEKRKLADEESKHVSEAEQVAQVLRGRAQDSRSFADKIREI